MKTQARISLAMLGERDEEFAVGDRVAGAVRQKAIKDGRECQWPVIDGKSGRRGDEGVLEVASIKADGQACLPGDLLEGLIEAGFGENDLDGICKPLIEVVGERIGHRPN